MKKTSHDDRLNIFPLSFNCFVLGFPPRLDLKMF